MVQPAGCCADGCDSGAAAGGRASRGSSKSAAIICRRTFATEATRSPSVGSSTAVAAKTTHTQMHVSANRRPSSVPNPLKAGYRVGGGLKRGWGRASGVGGVGSGPGLSRRGEGVTPVGPSSGFPTSPPRARPVRRRTSSLPLLRHHSTSRRFPLGSVTSNFIG